MPEEHAAAVRTFAADFKRVTDAWVAQGHHTSGEVAEWRITIRRDMESYAGVDPQIDSRPQGVRIRAWCRTFRELARKLERSAA